MGLITILGSGLFFFIIVAIFLLIVMFALHIKFKIENLEKDQEKTRKLTHSMAGIVKELSNDVIKLEKNANETTATNLEEKTQNDIYTLFSSVNDLQLEVDALKYNNQQKLNDEDDDDDDDNNNDEDDDNNENKKGGFKNKSNFFGKNAETNLLFSNLCNQQPTNSIHSFFSNIFNANNKLGIIGDTDNEDESNNNSNVDVEYEINSIIYDFEFDQELSNSGNNTPTEFQSPNVVKLDEEENENVANNDEEENDEEEDDNKINDLENVFDDFDKDFNEEFDAKLNLETNEEEKQQIEVSMDEPEFYPQNFVQEITETNNEDIILQQNDETQQQTNNEEEDKDKDKDKDQEQQTNKLQKITNVNKLSLPELRCLVVEHGLIENAIHLKKNQIMKLIEQHNKSIDDAK